MDMPLGKLDTGWAERLEDIGEKAKQGSQKIVQATVLLVAALLAAGDNMAPASDKIISPGENFAEVEKKKSEVRQNAIDMMPFISKQILEKQVDLNVMMIEFTELHDKIPELTGRSYADQAQIVVQTVDANNIAAEGGTEGEDNSPDYAVEFLEIISQKEHVGWDNKQEDVARISELIAKIQTINRELKMYSQMYSHLLNTEFPLMIEVLFGMKPEFYEVEEIPTPAPEQQHNDDEPEDTGYEDEPLKISHKVELTPKNDIDPNPPSSWTLSA